MNGNFSIFLDLQVSMQECPCEMFSLEQYGISTYMYLTISNWNFQSTWQIYLKALVYSNLKIEFDYKRNSTWFPNLVCSTHIAQWITQRNDAWLNFDIKEKNSSGQIEGKWCYIICKLCTHKDPLLQHGASLG